MGLIENVNMSSVKAIPMAILPSSQIQRSIDDQIKRGLDKSFPKSNIKVDDDVWNIMINWIHSWKSMVRFRLLNIKIFEFIYTQYPLKLQNSKGFAIRLNTYLGAGDR